MEKRLAKLNISSAGGTAGKGSKTCKVTLPTSWIDSLGISEEQREVELSFDGEKIVIARHMHAGEFVQQALKLGHEVRKLRLFDKDILCTTIFADFTAKTLAAENNIDNLIKTAFGNNPLPCWDDFMRFLEERCVPRQRAGLREYLEAIGVSEYDPLEIIKNTAGRMAEDEQWLELEVLK